MEALPEAWDGIPRNRIAPTGTGTIHPLDRMPRGFDLAIHDLISEIRTQGTTLPARLRRSPEAQAPGDGTTSRGERPSRRVDGGVG